MNYLAHAYLSFEQEEVLVGNMISDYVKGKTKFEYAPKIQIGIALHRKIDSYTDDHPIIKDAKKLFQPSYRLYAGAFIDVIMDYYLAKKLNAEINFMPFTQNVYSQLAKYYNIFPEAFQKMFPYMQQQNWLFHYQFKDGLQKSLTGLQRRAKYIEEVTTAFTLLEQNEALLESYFEAYWPQLFTFATISYQSLINSFPTPSN